VGDGTPRRNEGGRCMRRTMCVRLQDKYRASQFDPRNYRSDRVIHGDWNCFHRHRHSRIRGFKWGAHFSHPTSFSPFPTPRLLPFPRPCSCSFTPYSHQSCTDSSLLMSAGVASVGKIQWRLSGQISKVRDFFIYPFPEMHTYSNVSHFLLFVCCGT